MKQGLAKNTDQVPFSLLSGQGSLYRCKYSQQSRRQSCAVSVDNPLSCFLKTHRLLLTYRILILSLIARWLAKHLYFLVSFEVIDDH